MEPVTPVCDTCGRASAPRYALLGGHICNTCYSRLRRHPAPCPSCARTRVLAFPGAGGMICAACAGQPPRFGCQRCGSEAFLTGSHCGSCRLQERLDDLLHDEDGTIRAPLHKLVAYLRDAPMDPRSTVRWIRRANVHAVLRNMATGRVRIAHQSIDALPTGAGTRYLRRVLIEAGVLPGIQVLIHELTLHAEHLATELPGPEAAIFRRYYRWGVLPGLHKRHADDDLTPSAHANHRGRLNAVAAFFVWVHRNGHAIRTVDQSVWDHYTARRKATRPVAHFLRWAATAGLAPPLTTSSAPTNTPIARMPEEELWTEVEHLLTDTTIELPVRIAGLFAIIYAQPLERTARLTRDRVDEQGTSVTVRFGATPITMPPSIAQLIRDHWSAPLRRGHATGHSQWLFEGIAPNSHLSASYLRLRLTQHGIPARAMRDARLEQLSRELNASIVADTLGITTRTATVRQAQAGGTWAHYPQLRDGPTIL